LLANDDVARSFVARALYDNKLGFEMNTGYGQNFMDRENGIYEKVRIKKLFGAALVDAVPRKQQPGRRSNRLGTMRPE